MYSKVVTAFCILTTVQTPAPSGLLVLSKLVDFKTGKSFSPEWVKLGRAPVDVLFVEFPFVIYGLIVSDDSPISQEHCWDIWHSFVEWLP